ncbi:hypothetical protein FSPOR_136 [Fusarium sporotrichioides]|uniref:RING-type domain-containing protein n=1 Tax=Fusarium sporotrichioides TaxID=5514 RepID=A0A395SVF4_FUSSP|nr:hypothetical protein FSPOR_136 [Fusarium sporotrichioides]
MAASAEFPKQEAAAFQLSYLNEWEVSHHQDNEEAPQKIVELRLIRPYLEALSMGFESWDEEKVGRLINQSILTSMQPASPAEATDTTAATVADAITRSPTTESGSRVCRTPTESVVKGEYKSDFGDRIVELSKSKLAKFTHNAWSFLQNGPPIVKPQPSQPEDVPCCHFDPNEEDLISFENDPFVGPNEAKPDSVKLKTEDHVNVTEPLQEVEKAVKCFTCGSSISDSVVLCPCQHRYCTGCLCHMVKFSIRDEIPFPPVCCGSPVPIDVNTSVFDQSTLCDFFCKKFGITCMTLDASPKKRKFTAMRAPSQDKTSPQVNGMTADMSKDGAEVFCYLCKRVNEKIFFCPECCYDCNRNRALCTCTRWKERQRRIEAQKVVDGNDFDPEAPVFRPANSSS